MSFAQIMQALAAMLGPIGQAVEALHPGDNMEAIKINTGTALVQAVIQVATAASQAPKP